MYTQKEREREKISDQPFVIYILCWHSVNKRYIFIYLRESTYSMQVNNILENQLNRM